MLMLPSKIILPCLLRFSSTVISVGSGFAFGSGSTYVLLMKSTAFTRFISFSFINGFHQVGSLEQIHQILDRFFVVDFL